MLGIFRWLGGLMIGWEIGNTAPIFKQSPIQYAAIDIILIIVGLLISIAAINRPIPMRGWKWRKRS